MKFKTQNSKVKITDQNLKLFRIIDANLNRCREGIRVVEDLVRFVFDDKKGAAELKGLRAELLKASRLSGGERLRQRSVGTDVGRTSFTRSEAARENLLDIFSSNIKRAQEAARCLEEFSKLASPGASRVFKRVRFKLYDLEKKLYPRILKAVKLEFSLYVVTDPGKNHLRMVRKAIAKGVRIVQLRDKEISRQGYRRLAKKVAALARKAGVTFIINDYWKMVKEIGADGVHLGQEDLKKVSLKRVRKEIGEDKIIGVSTHSLQQAKKAERAGADYISVGPIFKTPSKPLGRPVGIASLKRVLRRVEIPVVAIGGINRRTVRQVIKAGCQRFAAIRAAEELASLA
jgi:thiamine-phosphate pyrophosphorylase